MNTEPTSTANWRGLITLTLVALITASLLSWVASITREPIEQQRQAAITAALSQVIPDIAFDNALPQSRRPLAAQGFFQTEQPLYVYSAHHGDQTVALIFDVVTSRGYNGTIRLLIGVAADGRVSGIQVTEHRETPGLGDAIDPDKSDWLQQFSGVRRNQPAADQWRPGVGFDALSGATITATAVIDLVQRTLRYFAENREQLLALHHPADDDGNP
ncbi:MAG: electron transport complex subunit RsxG [Wenzhouxiangellaceae bacterium]